jgi:hypothetical protein
MGLFDGFENAESDRSDPAPDPCCRTFPQQPERPSRSSLKSDPEQPRRTADDARLDPERSEEKDDGCSLEGDKKKSVAFFLTQFLSNP